MTDSSTLGDNDTTKTVTNQNTKLLAETGQLTPLNTISVSSPPPIITPEVPTSTDDILTEKMNIKAPICDNIIEPVSTATTSTPPISVDAKIENKDDNEAGPSGTSTKSPSKDSLFEPTVDMMVNDFDDERTLEEEEALAAAESEDPNAELSSLQREGDMPIEELLALYNCAAPAKINGDEDNESEEGEEDVDEDEEEDEEIDEEPENISGDEENEDDEAEDFEDEEEDEELVIPPSSRKNTINKNKNRSVNVLLSGRKASSQSQLLPQNLSDTHKIYNTPASTSASTKLLLKRKLKAKMNMKLSPSKKRKPNHNSDGEDVDDEDDEAEVDDEVEEEEDDEPSALRKLYPETYNKQNSSSRLLRTLSRQQSEDEEDGDYSPDEDEFKKVNHIYHSDMTDSDDSD